MDGEWLLGHITDYGLAVTEIAGALMVLAFLRALLLYARARLRPAPALTPVQAPSWLRSRGALPAALGATQPAVTASAVLPPSGAPSAAPLTGEVLPPGDPTGVPPDSDLTASDVVLATRSMHVEEAPDGSRFFYGSLMRFRHHRRPATDG